MWIYFRGPSSIFWQILFFQMLLKRRFIPQSYIPLFSLYSWSLSRLSLSLITSFSTSDPVQIVFTVNKKGTDAENSSQNSLLPKLTCIIFTETFIEHLLQNSQHCFPTLHFCVDATCYLPKLSCKQKVLHRSSKVWILQKCKDFTFILFWKSTSN